MISTSAQSVLHKVNQLENIERSLSRIGDLKSADRVRLALVEGLHRQESRATVLKEAGVPHSPPPPTSISALRGVLSDLRQFQVEQQTNLDAVPLDRRVTAGLSDWNAVIEQDWSAYSSEKIPSLDESFVELLSRFPAFADEAAQILSDLQGMNQLANSFPQSSGIIDRFRGYADRIKENLEELLPEEPEVKNFLDSLATGGAPLSSLTPRVSGWLEEKELDSALRIVTGGQE